MTDGPTAPLLREGETCWRAVRAGRAAFLVDGDAFFSALADTLENAHQSIWLLGWDFHSEVRLRRDEDGGRPAALVPLLDELVRERPSLNVHVLAWDFAMLYALEREFLPLLQFGARTHRRIHFEMDSAQPTTASQHQKIVVVDDAVAFVGGFDLTAHRWDTRDHTPDDPRRVTPAGRAYPPFHDVQIAVDGEAAAAIGALARERWQRATGHPPEEPAGGSDPWPERLVPDVRDVRVGIAPTFPAYGEWPEVREVEALYRESIAAARRWIYLENQYLTCERVGEWLAERLREPDGPEVVFVGPRENSGWLEESTMGALRSRVVRRLREADTADRLRILHPHREGLAEAEFVNVHSKVMVVDDDFARVGSSNISNRSLGVDSECDLGLVSDGDEEIRRAIAGFRDDLLAEHLGTRAEAVARELARTGSLVRTIDGLHDETSEHTLRRLEIDDRPEAAAAVDRLGAIDPEHPIPLEELLQRFADDAGEAPSAGLARRVAPVVVPLLGIAALLSLWQLTPLGEQLRAALPGALAYFQGTWHGPLVAVALFTLVSVLLVPVTAVTAATGLALGPVIGIPVAWLGSIASAWIGYAAGRLLWRDAVRGLAGDRLNALSRRLARRGILATALLRVVPVAPFMVVNLVAGASHVRASDFVVGTALGVLPGTVLIVLGAGALRAALAAGDVDDRAVFLANRSLEIDASDSLALVVRGLALAHEGAN
ncbi:MAG: hypothetical protein HKP30_12885, partial [Myxococcales bacterium]|nr:hypothetical protein [Myxococcales bacterium]